MFSEALISYNQAIRRWVPLLTVHLYVRLISAALLVPFIGVLLAITLSFSDQSALTDQDIARFLLTPAGALGALIVVSLVIAAAVVDIAAMTAVLRSRSEQPVTTLKAAFGFLLEAAPRVVAFAGSFLLRVLSLSLPFVAVAGTAALYLLREFDINFYLTNRPPEFMLAVAIGAVSLGFLALLLASRLSGWAIALHMSVFDMQPTRQAFERSRVKMQGHKMDLLGRIVMWAVVRFVLATLLVSITGFLLATVPELFIGRLPVFFAVTSIIVIAWALLNACLSAIANGALADILNDEFARFLEARPAHADTRVASFKTRHALVPVLVVVVCLASLLTGGNLSNRMVGVDEVAVIGHRGAAATRPENTMASVIKAVEDGADWVEIDVQETADGEVLVVHDSDFMKAAGVATKVWDVTMDEVADIDIGSWFDPAYADARAPLLKDVLDAVKGRSKLIIELKYYGHDVDLENRVIALVEAAGMQDEIATMSLKYPAVQKMLSLRPDWRTGVLAATAVGDLTGLDGDFLAVSGSSVSSGLIARARASGKDVYVWTINDAATMSRMISIGADGLITDRPAMAREVIAFYQTLSTPERVMLRLGDLVGFTFDLSGDIGDEI